MSKSFMFIHDLAACLFLQRVLEEDDLSAETASQQTSPSTALIPVNDDEDEEVEEEEEIPTAATVGHADACREEAIRQGKKALQRYEPYVKSRGDSSLRQSNVYAKPLPYIIGTSKFGLSRSVGLAGEEDERSNAHHGMEGEGIDATSQNRAAAQPVSHTQQPPQGTSQQFPQSPFDESPFDEPARGEDTNGFVEGDTSISRHTRQETNLTAYVDEEVEEIEVDDELRYQDNDFGPPSGEQPTSNFAAAMGQISSRFRASTEQEDNQEHVPVSDSQDQVFAQANFHEEQQETAQPASSGIFDDPIFGESYGGSGGGIFGGGDELSDEEEEDEDQGSYSRANQNEPTQVGSAHSNREEDTKSQESGEQNREATTVVETQSHPQAAGSTASSSRLNNIFGADDSDSDSDDADAAIASSSLRPSGNTGALFGALSEDSSDDDDNFIPASRRIKNSEEEESQLNTNSGSAAQAEGNANSALNDELQSKLTANLPKRRAWSDSSESSDETPSGRPGEQSKSETPFDGSSAAVEDKGPLASGTVESEETKKDVGNGGDGQGSKVSESLNAEVAKAISGRRALAGSSSEEDSDSSDNEARNVRQPPPQARASRFASTDSDLQTRVDPARESNSAVHSDTVVTGETIATSGAFGGTLRNELSNRVGNRQASKSSGSDSTASSKNEVATAEAKNFPTKASNTENSGMSASSSNEQHSKKGGALVSQLSQKLSKVGFDPLKMAQPPARPQKSESEDQTSQENQSSAAGSSASADPDMEILSGDTGKSIHHVSRAKGPPRRRPRGAGRSETSSASTTGTQNKQVLANEEPAVDSDKPRVKSSTTASRQSQADKQHAAEPASASGTRKTRGSSAVDENSQNIASLFGNLDDSDSSDDDTLQQTTKAPLKQHGGLFDGSDSDSD